MMLDLAQNSPSRVKIPTLTVTIIVDKKSDPSQKKPTHIRVVYYKYQQRSLQR